MPKARPAAVAWVVLAVAAAAVPSAPAHGPTVTVPGATAGPGPNLSVVVDPASWWMETGANVTLSATWAGVPPGCGLQPIWFRWAIAAGGSDGVLGPSNGSESVFYAADQGGGTTTVAVRAAASVRCPGNVTAVFSRATSAVTVAVPLTVRDVAFSTDPVVPGEASSLVGSVVGGDPPYRVRVEWGDGNASTQNVSAPGGFAVAHVYGAPGSYSPAVVAIDSAGGTANAAPDEPLNVSGSFAAAIDPSTVVAEVGVPVTFRVATTNAPGNFSWLFECPAATPTGTDGVGGLAFGCAFGSEGVAPVTFEAVGAELPFPVATATLDEPVVPRPTLAFPDAPTTGEVARTTYAEVDLCGGVPPFLLEWSLLGTGASGTQTVGSDGLDYLPLLSGVAGTLELSVVAVDALNMTTPGTTEAVDIVPELAASAEASSRPENGSIAVNVSGSVVDGAAPFDWTVVPASPAGNASNGSGTLPDAADFAWNATYRREGSLEITVVVVDADGGSTLLNLTVVLAANLSVAAEVDPLGPGAVLLRATVTGGVPPFDLQWSDSAGDDWNASLAAAGTVGVRGATAAQGNCSFRVVVVDALGDSATANVSAVLPTDPPGHASSSVGSTALAVVAVLAVAGTAIVLLRRRAPAVEVAPPDPVAVLREVIEASDGVDRGLVEMLAQEHGVPLAVVRSTLERLKADGSVRAGRGSDGEEVLAWA